MGAKLGILPVVQSEKRSSPLSEKQSLRLEAQAIWERKWLVKREHLDPSQSAVGCLRMERTWELIQQNVSLDKTGKMIDLGCGTGWLLSLFQHHNWEASGIDVAKNAISSEKKVEVRHDCLPFLRSTEEEFTCVACCDVIAELRSSHYRLLISEMSALVEREGWLILSTPIDIHSEDALVQLHTLLKTEWTLLAERKSFHRLHLHLSNLLKTPSRFAQASKRPSYRKKHLAKRRGLSRIWFYIHSTPLLGLFWKLSAPLLRPLQKGLSQNKRLTRLLEKISETLWGEGATTHIIIIARRRPICYP